MKKNIHPKYYDKAKVTCSCGANFEVGSTKPEIQVEVCSACHPFYTGTQKFVDSARRVDKFKARLAKSMAFGAKESKLESSKKSAQNEKGEK